MKEILIIYNFAQKYRTAIFKAIDKEWNCFWMFGKNETDIKGMDLSVLGNAVEIRNKHVLGPIYSQEKTYKESISGRYESILMLGDPFNITTWKIMVRNRFTRHPKKIYLWSHGWYGREGFGKKLLKRLFFGLADKTFLYGNYAMKTAISYGFPKNKLAVIHNSLDHENQVILRNELRPSNIYKNHFGNYEPVLIFIGRLTPVKRLDLLINAIYMLKEKGKTYNVVLVGDGEMKEELKNLVSTKNLDNQVWFYGLCYDDNKNAQLIYDADLCVAPGNVGLTAMHSMVFGTPVITHNNFSMQMPEFESITPNITGDFFKYNDVSSLSQKIEDWIDNKSSKRDKIRQDCYDEIDRFWTPKYQMNILKRVIEN